MGDHPIQNLMRTTMDSIKSMVDVNTVVGSPVETKEGTVIIPVSRVSFGFVAGGGDEFPGGQEDGYYQEQGGGQEGAGSGGGQDEGGQWGQEQDQSYGQSMPFTGGAGAGVSVKPVGFLVVGGRKVRFLPVDSRALFDRLLDEAPDILERVTEAYENRRGRSARESSEGRDPSIRGPVH